MALAEPARELHCNMKAFQAGEWVVVSLHVLQEASHARAPVRRWKTWESLCQSIHPALCLAQLGGLGFRVQVSGLGFWDVIRGCACACDARSSLGLETLKTPKP